MKEKQRKKSGVSRLFEIAGEKKGLLMLAGVLSAVSALCMLVPYWSVYEVLKELLLHGSKISELDSSVLIHWGWVAFVGLVAGLLLLYGALMASHVAAFRILYGLRIRLSGHIGRLSLGYLNGTSTGAIKKTMEQNVEKIENFVAHTIPDDWTKCWQMLEDKWARANICNPGTKYNIDAKLNGAYIVIGLLYGEGDINKTLEISTRCGQDSDCNPSNALAVLGIIKGFSAFPQEYREAIEKIGDKPFVHTNYSFNKAVERTADYAEKLIVENGGKVTENSYSIVLQEPVALPMEDAFPNLVYSKRAAIVDADKDSCWTLKGNWQDAENGYVKYSEQAGDEITFTFEGTGASIEGWWVKNGGKADVYVDGIFKRTIDCFYYYAKQEHRNINIFHILNLEEGKHTINIVVKGEKREESEGCAIGVRGAVVYKNGTKSYDAI